MGYIVRRERKIARLEMQLSEEQKSHQADAAQMMQSVARLQKENKELFDDLTQARSKSSVATAACSSESQQDYQRQIDELNAELSRVKAEAQRFSSTMESAGGGTFPSHSFLL